MPALLPPLRLTGALTLRDGALQQRSVALADGRLTTGPHPAIDLRGYYVLPGIIDLGCTDLPHPGPDDPAGLAHADRAAACHGVTTRLLAQSLSWEHPDLGPAAATAFARHLAAYRPRARTDLRLSLIAETHLVTARAALLDLALRGQVFQVIFANQTETAADLRRNAPAEFARRAQARGLSAPALGAALDEALRHAGAVPRHLCDLAEAFDAAGIIYGSSGDPDAETREHFSMIGARLCVNPATARVAAAARAVNAPVLADAAVLLKPAPAEHGAPVLDLIQAGLCKALISGADSASLIAAAFRLTALGVLSLAQAWALIAENPARIARLPDRGLLAPGKRADLVVVNQATQKVEATICAGRLTYLTGPATDRFLAPDGPARLAAE